MNHLGTKPLETARLILRPFTVDDAQDMFDNWASDPEVTRHLTWLTHADVSQTRKWLAFRESQYADPAYYGWCAVLKETGRAVGDLSVVRINEEVRAAELGWVISRAQWGKGLMPEAGRAVIDFLMDEAGFNRVAARHSAQNPKSGRAMIKCGMRYEGMLRQSDLDNQKQLVDMCVYSILKSDQRRKDELL